MDKLPPIGTPETNRFDIKGMYSGDKDELGKDIAALANANGGALLYGTFEVASAVAHHKGLTKNEVKTLVRDVEHVVLYAVRPKVSASTSELRVDDERSCVVVSVEPSPGQAVGVRKDAGRNGPWDFPVRVGTQTDYFSPEQLVLLMDVSLRRKVQLLNVAMDSGEVVIKPTRLPRTAEIPQDDRMVRAAKIAAIDDRGASIRFDFDEGKVHVALRFVRDVWREDDKWVVWLAGGVFQAKQMRVYFRGRDLERDGAMVDD